MVVLLQQPLKAASSGSHLAPTHDGTEASLVNDNDKMHERSERSPLILL